MVNRYDWNGDLADDGVWVDADDYDALAARLAEAERWHLAVMSGFDVWQAMGPTTLTAADVATVLDAVARVARATDSAPAAPWTSGLLGYPCPTCGITLTADHDCTAETVDGVKP